MGQKNPTETGGGTTLPSISGQSGKFLSNNGSALLWGTVSAGFTPGKVLLKRAAGTWQAFATLALAKAAASSGDIIEVGPGTYNETDLAKNGVNWYFHDGASVTYTGATQKAIFDDGGAVMHFSVSGLGFFAFQGSVPPTSGAGVINFSAASSIFMRAANLFATTATTVGGVNGAGASVLLSADICGAIDLAPFLSCYVDVNSLIDPVDAIVDNGTSAGTATITARSDITSYGGRAIAILGASTTTITVTSPLISSASGTNGGIEVRAASATVNVNADVIVDTVASALYVTNGILNVRSNSVTGSTFGADGTGGELHLYGTPTLKATTTGGVAIQLGGQATTIHGTAALVSDLAATDSVTAAAPQNLKVYGFVAANKAKNGNVTVLTGGSTFSDANVT